MSGWKSTRDGPPTQTCTPHRSQRLPLVLNCLVAYNSGRSTSADQRARLDASRTLWPATCRSAASAHCPARDTQADDEHKRAWLAPPNTWAGKITDLGGGMPSLGTAIVTARARLGTQSPRRRKGGRKEQRFADTRKNKNKEVKTPPRTTKSHHGDDEEVGAGSRGSCRHRDPPRCDMARSGHNSAERAER